MRASKHTNRLLHELNIDFLASRVSFGQLAGNQRVEEVVHSLEDVIEKLRWLFCAGDASPFDVDQDGRTLLHVSPI